MVLLLIGALMYYLQSKEEMYEAMRPWVMVTNGLTFLWFLTLQYYRFKDTGRACSGDFLGAKLPGDFDTVYDIEWGQWLLIYTIA